VPFRQADQRVVALAAVMLNWATGSKLPESGYSVIYREIPLSPEELKARREHHLALLDAGMITRERAYQEIHPGTTEAEAKRDLAAIAAGQDLSAMSPEDLALMLQKIYLSVGVVVTPEEARVLMNKAGAGLTGPPPVAANTPRPGVATPEDDNTNG